MRMNKSNSYVYMNSFADLELYQRQLKVHHSVQFNLETFGLDQAKRIIIMDDAHDPCEAETNAMGENIHVENVDI